MKNILNDNFRGGKCVMAVNDMVEVISTSNPEIYGSVGTVKDIKTSSEGTELRIETKDGLEFWIDAEDVVIY
jgi:hypothetical protein